MKIKAAKKQYALVIDADIYLYQAVTDAMQEHRTADDEYVWKVDVDQVQDAIETRIETDKRLLGAGDVMLCFGSPTNWRTKVMPEYKAHRQKKKPLGYHGTMAWMMTAWPSIRKAPLEADDLVGCLMTKPGGWCGGLKPVCVSEDKDLNCVPGLHYNPREPERGIYHVTPEQARRNHMFQTLCGDQSDGYKGCRGIGEKSAERILMEHKLDMWAGVVLEFQKAGMTVDDALQNARVAHILTHNWCNLETGEVRYWSPPGGSVAGRGRDRPRVVRRVARRAS